MQPSKIKVAAAVVFEGSLKPESGELVFEYIPSALPNIYNVGEITRTADSQIKSSPKQTEEDLKKELAKVRQKLRRYQLIEVEQQQTDFGE